MGITFIDSILSLLTACCVVFAFYFVGHALSIEHGGWAWIVAGVLLLVGLGLAALTTRRIRAYARRHDQAHDHDGAHHHGTAHGVH